MWPPEAIRLVAEQWSKNLYTELNWQADSNRHMGQGEAGGFRVEVDGIPYGGYLKPTTLSSDQHPRAANEKIAADLAFHLGLPIPPVLLYRRPNCSPGEEPCTCISLIMYPEQFEWGVLEGIGGEVFSIVRSVLARNSGVVAFDAFVGNTDRNNGRNAIFGKGINTPAEDSFVFLDFANSLNHNHRWDNNGWSQVEFPQIFGPLQTAVDWKIISETIELIENLSDEVIKSVVTRIPDDYMTNDHKQVVTNGLLGRRSLIREVLARFAT